MRTFQNYHRHSHYSNVRIADSVTTNKDYTDRAVQLGHKLISSCEHGWQGRYIECFEQAQNNGLKFLQSAEAYWVKDRFEKDRTNCHIFLGAKNERGRRALNAALAEANITGFYGQPRLDVPLLLSLPADDIWVTTACIAYWRYDDIEDITKRFRDHFGNNFFLEVQYHNADQQKAINERILNLSRRENIPLIMGCDSHYILPAGAVDRSDYIASKGMAYPDESGFILDYPDGDTAYQRFAEQGVLNGSEIDAAMQNTNVFLDVEDYDCNCFNFDIKMPTLYPELNQTERDELYKQAIWGAWGVEKKSIDPSLHEHYESEIAAEVDIVLATKHADYFLVDQKVMERGRQLGGVITSTGRGSAVSFYTNKLLGLTDVDRIGAKVKMYPERFMSPTRILEAKTLADIDINVGSRAPFLQAQKEILGEDSSYEMIAYGTMKPKAAWKMYAKSQNVDFQVANEISAQIERYENALKHADEEDELDVLDYIEPQYKELFTKSEQYQGVISHMTPHPCATLLYQGNIREEIGLIKVKENLCCIMDGLWAEQYKFLKNDLLKVSVVDVIDRIYKSIGVPRHSVNELLEQCPPDSPVWNIYKQGCTLGINQVEQPGTSKRVSVYAPTNISELCAFVAAIRPGFKSMYKIFEERKPFSYDIPVLDGLLQTPEMPHSFVLYQESSMAVLNFAGIPMSECYEIIKNIAKKRVEKVLKYKEQFIAGFRRALIETEGQTESRAEQVAHDVWRILEDSSSYSFNCSHSYCVAIDSLYGAYLKTYYPLNYYETLLRVYEEKGDKDKMRAARAEAEDYFKIVFPPFKYGQDNRAITACHETNSITNSLSSIKGFSNDMANLFYECSQAEPTSFVGALKWLNAHSIKAARIQPLINIDYFAPLGNIPTLSRILNMFDFFKQGDAKTIKKDKVSGTALQAIVERHATGQTATGKEAKSYTITDMDGLLAECEAYLVGLNMEDVSIRSKMANQIDILGYVDIATHKNEDRRKLIITDLVPLRGKGGDVWAYAVFTRSVGSGKTARLTLRARDYACKPFGKGAILYASSVNKERSGYWYLYEYDIME